MPVVSKGRSKEEGAMKFLFLLFVIPISLLPMPVLHLFSSALAFLIYRVGGYRKKVVRANILLAFPEKSLPEILKIEKEFYLHMCDLIFESVKTFTISLEDFKKRMVYTTPGFSEEMRTRGVNLTGIGSHYNSWEWIALGISMELHQISFGVYKPLSNPAWDDLFLKSRQRFGIRMIPIKSVRDVINRVYDRPIMLGLLADQAPHDYEKAFEVEFLGQKTYVTPGPAIITIQRGFTPIWGWAQKVARSRYDWGMEEIVLSPEAIESARQDRGQIERLSRVHGISPDEAAYGLALTRDYTARLEKQIKMAPQFWLWSHRRWKSR